jgi:hypothetical protein
MSTETLQSIAVDSSGHPSYAAALILQDLLGKRSGKCPCHIIATTGLAERVAYELLADLLALEWVEVHLPPAPEPELERIITATLSAIPGKDESGKASHWGQFFRALGAQDSASRYYVRITSIGERMLRSYKPL